MNRLGLKVKTDWGPGSPPVGARRGADLEPVTPVGRGSFEEAYDFRSGGRSSLTPRPVAIDIPSPGSFDPMLEHFLRPPTSHDACNCLLQRATSGRDYLMLLEEGNIPLIRATRTGRNFTLSGADGTAFATLSYETGERGELGCYLLRQSAS